MKIQIRKGVFETNSSSTHSIVLCKTSDWDDFVRGRMLMKNFPDNPEIVPADGVDPDKIFNDYVYDEEGYVVRWPADFEYMSFTGWCNVECLDDIDKTLGDVKAISIYYDEE